MLGKQILWWMYHDRFRRHGSQKLSPIQTRSTSRMSLPMSRCIWHHQRHPVHLNSSCPLLPRVTNCRTLSHFHITEAEPVLAVTLVTCRPQILSLRQLLLLAVIPIRFSLTIPLATLSYVYSVDKQSARHVALLKLNTAMCVRCSVVWITMLPSQISLHIWA